MVQCYKPTMKSVQGTKQCNKLEETKGDLSNGAASVFAGHLVFEDISSEDSSTEEFSDESLQNQFEDESATWEEASEAEYEAGVSRFLEMSPNANEPKRKEHELTTLKHKYTFKQTIDNLHVGRPAYYNASDGSTKSTMKVKIPSSGIQDVCSSGGKSKRVGDSSLSE